MSFPEFKVDGYCAPQGRTTGLMHRAIFWAAFNPGHRGIIAFSTEVAMNHAIAMVQMTPILMDQVELIDRNHRVIRMKNGSRIDLVTASTAQPNMARGIIYDTAELDNSMEHVGFRHFDEFWRVVLSRVGRK